MKVKKTEWPCYVGDVFMLDGREVEVKLVCKPSGNGQPGWLGVWFDDPENWNDPDKWQYKNWNEFEKEAVKKCQETQSIERNTMGCNGPSTGRVTESEKKPEKPIEKRQQLGIFQDSAK